jgi:anti-sigma regulatory factor (Ser/Thr protein kinase)
MTDDSASMQTSRAGLAHEALMYHDQKELEQALREFLSAAAAAGEPVLVALPSDHLERIRTALGETVEQAWFQDMERIGGNPRLLLPAIQEWVDEHRAHGGRVRIISEAIWPGRSYAEIVECLRHEALVNDVLADSDATILSAYDADQLDAETLLGAELTHPTVIGGDGHRHTSARYGDPIELQLGDRWPLQSPSGPVSEHHLDGTLSDLRHAVAGDPLLGSLSVERRQDLVFAVNEAASNAIRHGDQGCTARIWHDGRSVVTEVCTDSGFDDPLAGRRRPDPDATNGRGLWLINQVCDLVELRSGTGGTTLRMHIRD